MNKKYDVVGIGNALVDVTVHVDEATLGELDLQKGFMHLVSADGSKRVLEQLKGRDTTLASGGSIANSLSGLSSLGNRTAFIGNLGVDAFADTFVKDLEAYGVTPHISSSFGYPTGHAIIFVTPDGERTFVTHVGAAALLAPSNISKTLVQSAKILYIEGYVLAHDAPREAAFHAATIAKESTVKVAVDMSNISVVQEQGEHLKRLVDEYADIVFANRDEAHAYTGKVGRSALAALGEHVGTAIVTMHDEGSLLQHAGKVHEIPAVRAKVVNASGAGDMYAAGILHGIVHGLSLDEAGKIASYFAAKAVEVDEARLPLGYVQEQFKKEFGS